MDATKRAYLELHIAVMLWGLTAILGDLIKLSALNLVWWRVMLTGISLLFFLRQGRVFWKMPRKSLLKFAFVGMLTGLHWLTWYGAIKLANASVALICMACVAFFTSLIEPLIMRQKVKGWEIFLGFLIIPGMALIVGSLDVSLRTGFWVGIFAALIASVFGTLNKKWINEAGPLSITFIEMASAWLFLSLILPFTLYPDGAGKLMPTLNDFLLLLVLSLLCTTLTWMLALRALKHLSAFASNLTTNLEPVYGILLAWVFLDDRQELSPGFYWGALLILAVVFSYPFLNRKGKKTIT